MFGPGAHGGTSTYDEAHKRGLGFTIKHTKTPCCLRSSTCRRGYFYDEAHGWKGVTSQNTESMCFIVNEVRCGTSYCPWDENSMTFRVWKITYASSEGDRFLM